MSGYFRDPKVRVGSELMNWLDANPNHHLDMDYWKSHGPMFFVRGGIVSTSTYEYVLKHGMPHVRGLINAVRKAHNDNPNPNHEKELRLFKRDFKRIQKESRKINERNMILGMQMQDQTVRDMSIVIGRSEDYVYKEIKQMQTEGWCGK